MVNYTEASAKTLALNLVRLRKLLMLAHHSVRLNLLHAAIDHLRVVAGRIGAVNVCPTKNDAAHSRNRPPGRSTKNDAIFYDGFFLLAFQQFSIGVKPLLYTF